MMKPPNIYPFTVHATDIHYPDSPAIAKRLWHRDRLAVAPNLSWYEVSMEVTGPEAVTLHVHEMANSFYGGIGEVIIKHQPELTPEDLAELQGYVRRKQMAYACDEQARRETARIAAELEAIRRELFEPA